jgi:hypothetical protein
MSRDDASSSLTAALAFPRTLNWSMSTLPQTRKKALHASLQATASLLDSAKVKISSTQGAGRAAHSPPLMSLRV